MRRLTSPERLKSDIFLRFKNRAVRCAVLRCAILERRAGVSSSSNSHTEANKPAHGPPRRPKIASSLKYTPNGAPLRLSLRPSSKQLLQSAGAPGEPQNTAWSRGAWEALSQAGGVARPFRMG
ncbi:hypothetical protein AOLI_G00148600 [Acnodon oligacanthus]